MARGRLGRVLRGIAAVALFLPRPAHGADEVSGSFTVNGKTTPFAVVYAYWKPNFFDPGKPDLFVLFSDVAIPAGSVPKSDDGVSRMAALVREGKVHALELHLSPATRRLDEAENAAVYHVGLSPARHGMSGMHVFEATTFDARTVAGRARTEKEQESDGAKWRYDVRFKVALPPKPGSGGG